MYEKKNSQHTQKRQQAKRVVESEEKIIFCHPFFFAVVAQFVSSLEEN